ncbi:MAG TPA: APC family permease [Bryobacteraceae bacterium]|nr:APC family permease [Bryobacteraceae bacterium]
MAPSPSRPAAPASQDEARLRKELGLRDLALAQVLCVVGSFWVGVAAELGRSHVAFWLGAMLLFYAPLAVVVIYLNRLMPLEGGLYQWGKLGFNAFLGFLIAWNLWMYAMVSAGSILFSLPTDIAYMIGPGGAWVATSKAATLAITGLVMLAIAVVAVYGLGIGKILHNTGSIMILTAYVILLALPVWALLRGAIHTFQPFPWKPPAPSWRNLAIFGQMTVGALSGFEYLAILAGESRNPEKTIGRSVMLSAPVIALMFILGTSSVLTFLGNQPINLIGPIPQTFRAAFGATGWLAAFAPLAILLIIGRSIANSSLLFTGLTRLPMTAGWDHLLPRWFTRLHPERRTPVNSILFTAILIQAFIVLSLLGVHEQEANQLLINASDVHYAIAYVALFALPLFGGGGLRRKLPGWVKVAAAAGLFSSLVALLIAVYPIVDVVSPLAYAAKISVTVIVANIAGVAIYGLRRVAA